MEKELFDLIAELGDNFDMYDRNFAPNPPSIARDYSLSDSTKMSLNRLVAFMETYYEKAKYDIEHMTHKQFKDFAEWYLGKDSDAYKENAHDRVRLGDQVMTDLYNDHKTHGDDSPEMEEIYRNAHYTLNENCPF